jgi:uncharacterized membrane protein YidH (DUF202 family)
MILFFTFLSVLSLIFGIFFLAFPKVLLWLSEWGNKVLISDRGTLANRFSFGSFLIILGIIFYFVGRIFN